ncbi:FHA domain containing protein [Candidatus Korarchaeum cryptofilum OPF8]|uniref:FHA domain containing protein n=1 Tax=Korarchaeum cryptofilum (strain OPF8) TaxID=374847 RepID=B1L7F0_KORCO|nr:FHA domain containing protein [Candidatus Korarchaeum cryptofilum OPF8]
MEVPRREEIYEGIHVRAEEKRARLLGPNGLTIELELGVRAFGRRDFVGYVPEEDLDYISRRHFEIKGTKEGYFIRDLGSLNGTWVNGNRIGREFVKLVNGAVIDVAEVARLRFSYESEDLGVPEI